MQDLLYFFKAVLNSNSQKHLNIKINDNLSNPKNRSKTKIDLITVLICLTIPPQNNYKRLPLIKAF